MRGRYSTKDILHRILLLYVIVQRVGVELKCSCDFRTSDRVNKVNPAPVWPRVNTGHRSSALNCDSGTEKGSSTPGGC